MMWISPALRLSVGLVFLTVSILLGADMLGLVPDRTQAVLDARKTLCETFAVQFSVLASKGDLPAIRTTLTAVVERNDDILSAGLRRQADGALLAEAGDHLRRWITPQDSDRSTPTAAQVPIFAGDQRWGTVEVVFTPVYPSALFGLTLPPILKLVLFVALACLGGYLLFMRRALRHLDPSALVPARVRAALDALSEGVVLMDARGHVALANRAFQEKTGRDEQGLLATGIDDWAWVAPETGRAPDELPWRRALRDNQARIGTVLLLPETTAGPRTFVVNVTPIEGHGASARGAMTTFDDVSALAAKNTELEHTMDLLRKSRHEIQEQNHRLQILATEDPLTGCFNRRALFEKLESDFAKARRSGLPVACIMADIDHFKSINDSHGHQFGDRVIRYVVEILRGELRAADTIGRYGGEEFCVLLWGTQRAEAIEVAERMRHSVATGPVEGVSVTASFGVALLEDDIERVEALVARADSALYTAKDSGRNRVVCWELPVPVPEAAVNNG